MKAAQIQESLFDELPEGIEIFRQSLSPDRQIKFVELCRAVVKESPLITPTMRDGTPLRLKITSCGKCGWIADAKGYQYARKHPDNRKPWAKMPREFRDFSRMMGEQINWIFRPDTCLLNFYDGENSRLRFHQDLTENDLREPICTLSLGDSCIFAIRIEAVGNEPSRIVRVRLDSGDCLMMHRRGRLLSHAVEKILPNTSNLLRAGGRISLTFRKAL